MKKFNSALYLQLFTLVFLGVITLSSCKTKKISTNPIGNFLSMENPYNEFNKSDRETMGFGDPTSGLKDSLSMCYDLLDDKDKDLRPIIGSLAEQNPGNEEIQFISAKNHMNLGNYARAIEGFSKLRSSDTYELMDQARYYYSLISVYLDNKDQSAIAVLEEISNDKKSEFQKLAVDVIAFL